MNDRIVTAGQGARLVREFKSTGRRVVFTNGCFDILHPGHLKTLASASGEGDILFVGLNSDSSVRRLKGRSRPVMSERDRAAMLCALQYVDYVIIFEEDTPGDLIETLRPDVLVKGGDWGHDEIVGRETVERGGGKVIRVKPLSGLSTTEILKKAAAFNTSEYSPPAGSPVVDGAIQTKSASTSMAESPVVDGAIQTKSVSTSMAESPVVVGVIPARYASTRFPGKPLALIEGVPMVERVRRRAESAETVDRVIVATDDERIADVVRASGGEAFMTDPCAACGTDRVIEVAAKVPGDYFVNIQGDEPLLPPAAVDAAVKEACSAAGAMVVTLAVKTDDRQALRSVDVVKVTTGINGQALYFSRCGIPYRWDNENTEFLKHIGLYVFPRPVVESIPALPSSRLETLERLEQLRWLEAGIPIKVVMVNWNTVAVDRPEDIDQVERELRMKPPGVE